jgi:hypothetical protein
MELWTIVYIALGLVLLALAIYSYIIAARALERLDCDADYGQPALVVNDREDSRKYN